MFLNSEYTQTLATLSSIHTLSSLDILAESAIILGTTPLFMVITLLAKKGGVGKSTVCLLLHEAFKRAGKSVAIQDWDAQGTSTRALSLIDGQRVMPNGEYDIHLYDTPPSLEHQATAAAVRSADIAIVVTRSEERRVGKECRSGW